MRKIFAVSILVIAMMFSGCFPTGAKETVTSKDFTGDKTFEYKAPHLDVSFEIPEIPSDLPMKIKLKEKKFDTEEMLDLFFSGKIVVEEWHDNYYADDSSQLNVSPGCVKFYDGRAVSSQPNKIEAPLNYMTVFECTKEEYRDLFKIGTELESFSGKSAADRATELFSTLGISGYEEPVFYAFSVNSLEKIRDIGNFAFAYNDKYPLTKDCEVYALQFSQKIAGIELAKVQKSVKDNTNDENISSTLFSPDLTVGLFKDNIFFVSARGIYESEYEVISDEPAKYDFNYALNELKNHLDKVTYQKETVINKAKPVYVPKEINEEGYVEFVLAWSFEGFTERGFQDDILVDDYKIIFYADTGILQEFKQ